MPAPPDAPLVDEGGGVRLRLLGRDARRHELRVDDDLGAGPALDPVDRLLELLDRGLAEHARLVVHRLVVDRVGKRRAGRRDRREDRQQEDEPDDERDGERRATGEPGVTDGHAHACTIRNRGAGPVRRRACAGQAVATAGCRARIRRTSSAACS